MPAYRLTALAMLLVMLVQTSRAQDPQNRGVVPSGPPSGQPYGPPPPPPTPEGPPAPEEEPLPPKHLEITTIVEQTQRMSTKIAFVVDASGSMSNFDRLGAALSFSKGLLGEQSDALEVAIYAFRDAAMRWPGFPHDGNGPPPPPGWTFFPSEPAYRAAASWLSALGAGGNTDPTEAVQEALAENIDDLTVVIITDGEFDGNLFKQTIERAQAARVAAGHDRAVIIAIGVGPNAKNQQHMKDVGTSELGGFYCVREADDPLSDEPLPDEAPGGY